MRKHTTVLIGLSWMICYYPEVLVQSLEVGSKVFWLVPSSVSDLMILMDLFLKLARDSSRVILVRQFFLTLLLMYLQKFLVKLLPTI
jgi:hypothetical protein